MPALPTPAARPRPQPSRRRWLAAALAAAALPAAPGAGAQAQRRPWPPGRPTPPLALPRHHGPGQEPDWQLSAARGHALLLNFWASWCEPCRNEMPSLERLARHHAADGLLVLAVNHRETDATIQRFLAQLPLGLTILRDTDGGASQAWGAQVFPTTVGVSARGQAVFSVFGEVDWDAEPARGWVAALL